MYQEITVLGNAGEDAQIRYTPSGRAVTSFGVAVNEEYGDQKTTTWFRVTCWEKLAEIASQYVTKGKQVLIVGKVSGRAYTIKATNEPAMSLEINCRTLKLLGTKTEQGVPVQGQPNGPVTEDDIPF